MTAAADRRVLRLSAARAVCRLVVGGVLFGSAALADRAVTGRADQPPFAGVVAVTVVVATVLWVLRDPIDRLAARVVLGRRADGYVVMRELTAQLAATLPVDEVAPRVAEAASRTTGRPRAEVRLWLTDGDPWARSWPASAASIGQGTAVEVRHTGIRLGEIVVENDDAGTTSALSSWDRRMLDTLARPAGPALSTVRLTVELRQRKTELERLTAALEASRQRLLTARTVEQQRMRAEVAARVGTHLSAALAAVDGDLAGTDAADRLGTTAREAQLALEELRTIARGIYPPTLAEVGLTASLESWLARAGVDAALDLAALPGDDVAGGETGTDPEVAACLYFCAVTSMGRLARHGASGIRVAVADRSGRALSIEACVDETIGRDVILAVTDRIEASGGRVQSRLDERGFALVATLPAWRGGST